jgi:hypothetical protein
VPDSVLHFAYNVPVSVSLVDPQGEYDDGLRQGKFQTTAGQTFVLPRPAVELLYGLDPRPEEEIQITKHWSGKPREMPAWTICLSPRSEQFRAAEEIAQDDAHASSVTSEALQASIEAVEAKRPLKSPPIAIRKPAKRQTQEQPRLFDRGTGTDGPAPQPQPIPAAAASPVRRPPVIPWNVAFREVAAWVAGELAANKLQWSDEAQQAMVCTCLIAEVKAGRIGPWERSE